MEDLHEYADYSKELILRDRLALDRTKLANERTHLAYMRTVVSLIVAAITLYDLLEGVDGIICAGLLSASAIYFFIRGTIVCTAISKKFKQLYLKDTDLNKDI